MGCKHGLQKQVQIFPADHQRLRQFDLSHLIGFDIGERLGFYLMEVAGMLSSSVYVIA